MMNLARILITALGLSLAAPAMAGPMGFEMGQSLLSIQRKVKEQAIPHGNHVYEVKTAPMPVSGFESYVLFVTPAYGLCSVSAVSRDIDTSNNGIQMVAEYERLERLLGEKYGRFDKYDVQRTGTQDNWMAALLKKERVFGSTWPEKAGAPLPGDIASIQMEAFAETEFKGYIRLSYVFSNYDKCKSVTNAADRKAL